MMRQWARDESWRARHVGQSDSMAKRTSRRGLQRYVFPVMLSAAALSAAAQDTRRETLQAKPGFIVIVKDGAVTLSVKNAELLEVLREVCRQTDIKLTVRGSVPETVTRRMRQVPLFRALKKLLRQQNYEMVLTSTEPPSVRAIRSNSSL